MAKGQIFDLIVEGEEDIIASLKLMEKALQDSIPQALEDATKPTIAMMKRLAPKQTGALANSIRFTLGAAGGQARTTKGRNGPGSRGEGKTRIIGYIVAGGRETLKGGNPPTTKRRRKGAKHADKWNNARLQEFGTVKMPANPYFYPSWRATKAAVKKALAKAVRNALKTKTPSKPATSEAA
jgi:HK97 gp10 family phage protein